MMNAKLLYPLALALAFTCQGCLAAKSPQEFVPCPAGEMAIPIPRYDTINMYSPFADTLIVAGSNLSGRGEFAPNDDDAGCRFLWGPRRRWNPCPAGWRLPVTWDEGLDKMKLPAGDYWIQFVFWHSETGPQYKKAYITFSDTAQDVAIKYDARPHRRHSVRCVRHTPAGRRIPMVNYP